MATYGLWVDVEWCTGCRACEIACRQERNLAGDQYGIKVHEIFLNEGRTFDNLPVPTDLCNLCVHRTIKGQLPACVHHCMAQVLECGPVGELAERMAAKPRSMIYAPRQRAGVAVGG